MGNKPIQQIHIKYFKFFTDNDPININGNHVLLYGENGSGKSSIYWALYTLLEAVSKDTARLDCYFTQGNNSSLLNLNTPNAGDSLVKLTLQNSIEYKIALNDYTIKDQPNAQATLLGSDFINYRFMFKIADFKHGDEIDLFSLFEKEVFPYLKTKTSFNLIHQTKQSSNCNEIWDDLKKGIRKPSPAIQTAIDPQQSEQEYASNLRQFVTYLSAIVGDINIQGNQLLSELGYPLLRIELSCTQAFKKLGGTGQLSGKDSDIPDGLPKIHLTIPSYGGKTIHKPQSFLNEAKWTAIGIAIRFAIVDIRQDYADGADFQLLVLDDLLVSLDMSNREKVLELIFSKYLSNYQVFILTHDRVLFEFVRAYIKQKSNRDHWTLLEMYEGENATGAIKYPVIIDSKANYFEKAESYFKTKDYTACAFYLRKEIERLVKERLTEDYTRTFQEDQKPHNLKFLWDRMCERYQTLNRPITTDLKSKFESSKLLVMNAQAHDNLSLPVYKLEIEKALEVVREISLLVIPNKTFLLTKGMRMRFQHPQQDYTFDFELLQDFYIDNLDSKNKIQYPKCRILTWQFEGSEFWDFREEKAVPPTKPKEYKLKNILSNLLRISHLSNSQESLLTHTTQVGGIWSLKDILSKAGINDTELFTS